MDKIYRLLDAFEHPDNYTDAELQSILEDPESLQIHDILRNVKAGSASAEHIDVDAEWQRFANRHTSRSITEKSKTKTTDTPRPLILRLFGRHVAAAVIVACVAMAGVATGIGVAVSHKDKPSQPYRITVGADRDKTQTDEAAYSTTSVEKSETDAEVITYRDQSLAVIVDQLAGYYGLKTHFSNAASKNLRLYFKWDQNCTPAEVVEQLNNFEQVKITLDGQTLTVE